MSFYSFECLNCGTCSIFYKDALGHRCPGCHRISDTITIPPGRKFVIDTSAIIKPFNINRKLKKGEL